jgi:hypothetical protein
VSDAADEVVEVRDELRRRDRDLGLAHRDEVAGVEVRLAVAGGLQVDVLLADRGAVADHGAHVGGHLRAGAQAQVDLHAAVDEVEVLDLARGHAAVGDLGALEDAAGVDELRRHDVALVEEVLAEPA